MERDVQVGLGGQGCVQGEPFVPEAFTPGRVVGDMRAAGASARLGCGLRRVGGVGDAACFGGFAEAACCWAGPLMSSEVNPFPRGNVWGGL